MVVEAVVPESGQTQMSVQAGDVQDIVAVVAWGVCDAIDVRWIIEVCSENCLDNVTNWSVVTECAENKNRIRKKR